MQSFYKKKTVIIMKNFMSAFLFMGPDLKCFSPLFFILCSSCFNLSCCSHTECFSDLTVLYPFSSLVQSTSPQSVTFLFSSSWTYLQKKVSVKKKILGVWCKPRPESSNNERNFPLNYFLAEFNPDFYNKAQFHSKFFDYLILQDLLYFQMIISSFYINGTLLSCP